MTYAEFIASKQRVHAGDGFHGDAILPAALYSWQAAIVRWAIKKGRAAVWADCGLGKSFMQIAWAKALDVPTLFLAPLCVAFGTDTPAGRVQQSAHETTTYRLLLRGRSGGLHHGPARGPATTADVGALGSADLQRVVRERPSGRHARPGGLSHPDEQQHDGAVPVRGHVFRSDVDPDRRAHDVPARLLTSCTVR